MEFKTQTFTVADLYNWYTSKELYLQPRFQRRLIWKQAARSYLIDTVLRGLPMPKIYYRMEVNPETVKSVREIVDGQQRLDALFEYIENRFPVYRTHNPIAAGKRFGQLPQNVQSQILSYDISADLLIGANDSQVLQIFARINSYSITLNDQEKRNAKYFGLFKQHAYELGTAHVDFWAAHKILTAQNVARMAEAELTSELLIALMAGIQDKKKSINQYYENYEDSFADAKATKKKFEGVMSWIDTNAGTVLKQTLFRRKAMFYSLFVAAADAMYGIEKGNGPIVGFPKRSISTTQTEILHKKLKQITAGVNAAEKPKALVKFAIAAASQTDNLNPRLVRHNYLFEILESL